MSLTFETARITGLHHKVEKPGITGKIEITGVFTAKIAEAMGARWVVFDKEQIIKGGFKTIELDYALQALRLRFTPKGNLDKFVLDVPSQGAGHFKVMTLGDGKKKAKKLLVKFKVDHAGSQVPLIQYLEQIGGAEGKLELLPDLAQSQKQMFGDNVKPDAAAETARAAQAAAAGARSAVIDQTVIDGLDDAIDPDGANGEPAPSFHERMQNAKDADEGRQILHDLATAIAALEASGGIKVPTVGNLPNIGYRGFSVVTPKEWKAVYKRIKDNGNAAIAAQFQELIEDGRAAHEEFSRLVAEENKRMWKKEPADVEAEAATE